MRLLGRLRRWLRWRKFPNPDYFYAHEYGTGEQVTVSHTDRDFTVEGRFLVRPQEEEEGGGES